MALSRQSTAAVNSGPWFYLINMMKTNILVIGRHQQIMETVVRLINAQPDWCAQGATTDEQAIEIFSVTPFQLVLIGGGVEEESESKLKMEFEKINPQIKVIRHFGGGSGLLFNEIHEALALINKLKP
jgi:DNA-binding NtrC family response regulator